MTEREKMVSGELYDPTDKELEQFLISPAWMYVKYIQEIMQMIGPNVTLATPMHPFYLKNVIAEKRRWKLL